jgi:hypothetical protein
MSARVRRLLATLASLVPPAMMTIAVVVEGAKRWR